MWLRITISELLIVMASLRMP